MQLAQITHDVCPVCNSHIARDEKYNLHCSGEWNQIRVFECGYKLTYSPNFRQETVEAECPRDIEEIQRKQKQASAKELCIEFFWNLDVNQTFKNKLIESIEYVNVGN